MDNYSNNNSNNKFSNGEDKKLLINSAIGFIVLILQITVLLAYLSILSGNKVLFTDNDGNVYSEYIAQGGVLKLPDAPEREGYTFDGWYLEDGTKITFEYKVKKNTKILAKWTADYIPPVIPLMPAGITFKSISGGDIHTLALDSAGDIWTWGDNYYGQLGDGTLTSKRSPVKIEVPGTKFQDVGAGAQHSVALDTAGNIWTWGRNPNGQLGNGTEFDSWVPVQIVVTGTKFKAISVTYVGHTLAIDTSGNIWAWGLNTYGQVGDGTTDDCFAPKQITDNGVNYVWIGASANHSIALDEDGFVWAWGLNSNGQLGDGTTIDNAARRIPAIRAGNKQFVSLFAGSGSSMGIDAAGDIWAWGINSDGRIGDGTTINRTSPVQIAADKNFKSVYARGPISLALDASGNLWAWGNNEYGQLGDGTILNRYLPVQIAEGTKFESMFAGRFCNFAVDTSGNLWAWGNNNNGQLGDGTTKNKNTPVMIYSKTGGYVSAEVTGAFADIYTIIPEGDAGAGIALAITEVLIMAGFVCYIIYGKAAKKKLRNTL